MRPKILIVAEMSPWSLGRSFIGAFSELGYGADSFDLKGELARIFPLADRRGFSKLGRAFWFWVNLRLLLKCKSLYDLILVIKADSVYPSTLRRVRHLNKNVKVFNYNPDDPWRIPGASTWHVVNAIPLYDAYFIFGTWLVERIRSMGCKNVFYLPFAYDPYLHPSVSLQGQDRILYECDIAFIGNWGRDPEREELLLPLCQFNLAIWGNDWGQLPRGHPLRAKWRGRPVIGTEFVRVCLASKINLNHVRKKNLGEATTMRSFEIVGCGGFMLSNLTHELGSIFEEGTEVAFFRDTEELIEKARFYLANECQRMKMAQKARDKVLRFHCYRHRVETMMDIYSRLENANAQR